MNGEASDEDIQEAITYVLRRKELQETGRIGDDIDWTERPPNLYILLFIYIYIYIVLIFKISI